MLVALASSLSTTSSLSLTMDKKGMFYFYDLRIYVAKVASAKAWQLKLMSLIICY